MAQFDCDYWEVVALGAPHIGERSEKELITVWAHLMRMLSLTEADMKRFSLIKKEIDAHVAELRALVARLNDANIFN